MAHGSFLRATNNQHIETTPVAVLCQVIGKCADDWLAGLRGCVTASLRIADVTQACRAHLTVERACGRRVWLIGRHAGPS